MSARRVVAALLAMMLGAAVISLVPAAPPASADGAPADSAMTKSGSDEFANLKVTVSQTKDLINQTITVSWTSGVPTTPLAGFFSRNFLQIMQCWGDDPNGPDRTQCQFGAAGSQDGVTTGSWVGSRQVTYPMVDPKETLTLPAGGNAFVPFWAAGKDKPVGAAKDDQNDFFDSQVTNEVPLARTHADGTGVEYFEAQTVRQAAGLGCGDPVTAGGATKGRSCWLVIVPRGGTEVDGSTRTDTADGRLQSSALSETNWDKRIVFPLEFLPVGQACPIGAAERGVIGHELASDAVSSWQPALCASGATYTYTQQGDDVARNLLLGGTSPGLALMTNPIPPDQAPPDHPLVYAPVGLSALAIAFNVERQPPAPADPNHPTPVELLAGQRFTSMKLTPRLVAKLLTQSYKRAVQVPPDSMKNNPLGLLTDPEFLDLNPDFKGSTDASRPASDALVQLGSADVTTLLWSWVKADPDASAFLAGTPDPSEMVLNPNNTNLSLPTSTFPRNDQSCQQNINITNGVKGTLCTQDAHPFTNDMHDAGRSASRGDSKEQTVVLGGDGKTPTPAKLPRQGPGQRALLAVVDAATATRYGLPTAALRNTAGQFVAPTTASLLASERAMKPGTVAGVLASDPSATDPAAYPLTALSYAVSSPSTLDAAAGKDYAAFIRYAAGPGQQPGVQPGQLPLGMVPLPDALKAQAIAVAATIEAQAGKTPAGLSAPQLILPGDVPGGAIGSTGGPSSAPGSDTATTNSGGGLPSAPAAGVSPLGPTSPAPTAPNSVQKPVAVRRTPALPAPAVGALLLTILISGALAATSSPVLQSPVVLRLGAAVRRLLRKEVTPTNQ
jgi:hypothetical protein